MPDPSTEVTRLLQRWSDGDRDALDALMPMVIDEVKDLARKALAGESPGHTLQPTALVNEAYERLVGRKTYSWHDRREFFSSLAELMHRILCDHARRRLAAKRGGGVANLPLDERMLPALEPDAELVALDDALKELKVFDERRYRIVTMRFFMGMTQKEIATELGMSVNTVGRQWQTAKLWLQNEIQGPQPVA